MTGLKSKVADFEKFRFISNADEAKCLDMILNPDMFKSIQKHNSEKTVVKSLSGENANTPRNKIQKFDSFNGMMEKSNLVGEAVNLMVRSSKKSCEKLKTFNSHTETQKTPLKFEYVSPPSPPKPEAEIVLKKIEEIPEFDSKVDYQLEYYKLFQENEMKLQQYDKLLKEREQDVLLYR